MRTLDQLGGLRVRRRSGIWHERAHSISGTVRLSRSVRCLRCLCRMRLRGRGSRSLTRFWAWTADFVPCGCAWTWLYKYAHHQTSTTPQPCGWSRLGSSLRATRRVRKRSHSKEPPLNLSTSMSSRVQIRRGIDRREPKSYLHGGTFENRRYPLATRSMSGLSGFCHNCANAAFYSVNASDARRTWHAYNACVLWR